MEEKEQHLHEEFGILNESIDWWKGRANQLMGQIEMLEQKFNDDTADRYDKLLYEELMDEATNLLARGRLEDENLKILEDKTQKFLLNNNNTEETP